MYGNDDELELRQSESLRCFIEEIYTELSAKLGGYCSLNVGVEGIPFEIVFDTADRFSIVIVGSDTDNGDCFTVMTCFADFEPYITFSDRRPLSEFKAEMLDFWLKLLGNRVLLRSVHQKHKVRKLEFFRCVGNERQLVRSDTKLKGLAAFLLLWKDRETETICDLRLQ